MAIYIVASCYYYICLAKGRPASVYDYMSTNRKYGRKRGSGAAARGMVGNRK